MLNGGGIALLPSWVVGKDIQRGDATVLLPDYYAKARHTDSAVYAVYPYTHNVSAKVRAYIDYRFHSREVQDRARFPYGRWGLKVGCGESDDLGSGFQFAL